MPGIVATIAIVWAKMPADEIAHPLRDDPEQGPEQDLDKTDARVEV